jgi:hypothetical protein
VLSESEEENEDDDDDDDDEDAWLESNHDQPLATWAEKIEWVLQQHAAGGEATLSELYCGIEADFIQDIAGKPNWRAAVRSCLSTNTRNGRFVVEDTPHGRAWRLSQGH